LKRNLKTLQKAQENELWQQLRNNLYGATPEFIELATIDSNSISSNINGIIIYKVLLRISR
jgi:hypothetical protein